MGRGNRLHPNFKLRHFAACESGPYQPGVTVRASTGGTIDILTIWRECGHQANGAARRAVQGDEVALAEAKLEQFEFFARDHRFYSPSYCGKQKTAMSALCG